MIHLKVNKIVQLIIRLYIFNMYKQIILKQLMNIKNRSNDYDLAQLITTLLVYNFTGITGMLVYLLLRLIYVANISVDMMANDLLLFVFNLIRIILNIVVNLSGLYISTSKYVQYIKCKYLIVNSYYVNIKHNILSRIMEFVGVKQPQTIHKLTNDQDIHKFLDLLKKLN
jgi:hypothetical protein